MRLSSSLPRCPCSGGGCLGWPRELGHLPCALRGGWGGGKAGAAGGRDSGAPEPQESSPPGLGEAESSGRKPGVLGCQNQKGFQVVEQAVMLTSRE